MVAMRHMQRVGGQNWNFQNWKYAPAPATCELLRRRSGRPLDASAYESFGQGSHRPHFVSTEQLLFRKHVSEHSTVCKRHDLHGPLRQSSTL